ncbi:hypothetical protein Ancab_019052 [Ancistrocladus abbreviatus]
MLCASKALDDVVEAKDFWFNFPLPPFFHCTAGSEVLFALGHHNFMVEVKDHTHRKVDSHFNELCPMPVVIKDLNLNFFLMYSKMLKAFWKGEIEVLVSSDALNQGMDVEGVRNVINYDMPPYVKTYVHQGGRTTRAGQAGHCFTLLGKDEVRCFSNLLALAFG